MFNSWTVHLNTLNYIKLFQRGFMDPLDKILSMIVFNAILVVSEEEQEEEENTAR